MVHNIENERKKISVLKHFSESKMVGRWSSTLGEHKKKLLQKNIKIKISGSTDFIFGPLPIEKKIQKPPILFTYDINKMAIIRKPIYQV